jgi:hypothetical protein
MGPAATSCVRAQSFACETDQQCVFEGVLGVCADPGFCAFPDEECPSGYVFGDHAGEGLGGECVPADDSNDGGAGTDTESGGASDGSGTTDGGGVTGSGSTESTGTTTAPAVCGNGTVEPGEACDGPVDNGTCAPDCSEMTCNEDFANCNDDPEDGCEADLNEPETCGGCGQNCDTGGCLGQQCTMLVFTTAVAYTGDLDGLDGADALCQQEADDFGHAGTYRAWLSDGAEGPNSRFTRSSLPYKLSDGTTVAIDYTSLIDPGQGPEVALGLTLAGEEPPLDPVQICDAGVWTNVGADGSPGDPGRSCTGFTAETGEGNMGDYFSTDSLAWTFWCAGSCDSLRPLYCFQQPDWWGKHPLDDMKP